MDQSAPSAAKKRGGDRHRVGGGNETWKRDGGNERDGGNKAEATRRKLMRLTAEKSAVDANAVDASAVDANAVDANAAINQSKGLGADGDGLGSAACSNQPRRSVWR